MRVCVFPLLLLLLVSGGAPRLSAQDGPAVTVAPATEQVINDALAYLASQQSPNGAWIGLSEREQKYPVALTSYALMSFLAAGHLPEEGPYGRKIAAAVQYLLNSVSADGLIGNRDSGQYMYVHGIATIALAELYGQVNSKAIRPKLEALVKVIVSSQNRQGGWRYRPISNDADISVTVLQVVALRAAKNGGLKVPQATIDDAVKYVRSCYHEDSGAFSYQPGSEVGFARTAAAIYSLQVCGHYDDPRVKRGSEYLFDQLGERQRWFTYGNFYAAPAQYMIGGDTWRRWYARISGVLLERVRREDEGCYWDGASAVGPLYETAVNAMILAIPYQYVPLYQR